MDGTVPIPASVSALMRVAARRVVSHHLAEDVVQDVMLRFYASPQRFDPTRGSLGGYLLTATRRRALDLVREDAARARREIVATGSLATVAASVEWLVEEREEAERVVEAMRLLPASEREAITLAYFGGLSYRAVAEQLGVPEGTVKSRVRSGLARLRTILAALDPDA